MSKKKKQQHAQTPPAVPKWIENSSEPRTPQQIAAAIDARLAFRALRKASGLTQPEIAAKLGISLAAVQGAESGWRPVGRDLAKLVQTKLGVFASSVLGFTKEPVTILGERVTPASIKRAIEEQPRTISDAELKQFTRPLELLTKAAASAGRLRVFGVTYRDMLSDLKRVLDLENSLRATLNRQSPAPARREITRKELRESPELARALELLGIDDDPARPDNEKIETTIGVKREDRPWFPSGPLFSNWNEFVNEKGHIQWTDLSAAVARPKD